PGQISLRRRVEDQSGSTPERLLHDAEARVRLVVQAGDDQRALWRNARSEHRGGEQVGCEKHSVHTPSDRSDLIEQRLAVAGILEPALFARGIEWQAGVESRLQ